MKLLNKSFYKIFIPFLVRKYFSLVSIKIDRMTSRLARNIVGWSRAGIGSNPSSILAHYLNRSHACIAQQFDDLGIGSHSVWYDFTFLLLIENCSPINSSIFYING